MAISAASSRPEVLDQLAQFGHVDVEHFSGVVFRQALECDQQEGLARQRRDLREMALDRLLDVGRHARLGVEWHRIPDLGEELIERDAVEAPVSNTFGSCTTASSVSATSASPACSLPAARGVTCRIGECSAIAAISTVPAE